MMPLPSPNEDGLDTYKPLAEINVTPVVDVMLVLLIIFMVTAPMLAAGLSVNLPRANNAQPLPPQTPVIVTVAKDGGYLIGQEPFAREALADAVRARLGGDTGRAVHVQGDRETLYGNVVAAIDLLMTAGIGKVVMIVDRKSPAPAADAQHHHDLGDARP